MPYVDTPELRLHYQRIGSGPQRMAFVHGSFATSRWWQPVAELLPREEYSCYLWDLRGSGRSEHTDDAAGYRVEHQAADLAELLAALDLRNVHLVGHSLGAAIALTYAARHAGRLRSLVLVSTPSPDGTPTPQEGYELLQRMRQDRSLLMQGLASTMPGRPPDAFFQQLVDGAMAQAPAAFTENARSLADWRLPVEDLQKLRLPVLLVWGDRDQIVAREVQRRLLLAIPGANNLEVFRGAGHSPMLERTDGFVQALREFVEQDFDEFETIRGQFQE